MNMTFWLRARNLLLWLEHRTRKYLFVNGFVEFSCAVDPSRHSLNDSMGNCHPTPCYKQLYSRRTAWTWKEFWTRSTFLHRFLTNMKASLEDECQLFKRFCNNDNNDSNLCKFIKAKGDNLLASIEVTRWRWFAVSLNCMIISVEQDKVTSSRDPLSESLSDL